MRLVTTAVAVLALAASTTVPSATAANVVSFTAENVKAMVTEAGGSNVTAQTAQGITFVNFELNGVPFTYSLQLCDPKGKAGCAGVLMAIGVALDQAYSLETLNSFNRDIPLVTVVQLDAKTVAFGRFAVSLGGMSSENFKANMQMVAVGPELFVRHLKGQVVAGAGTAGQAVPVSVAADSAPKPIRLSPQAMSQLVDEDLLNKLNVK
ncbi:MAG: hypothetical protein JNL06_01540 [Alphaproteobacteria bacterium]|nr:hypothetical protein [Alphaproteobacteria bacterium]